MLIGSSTLTMLTTEAIVSAMSGLEGVVAAETKLSMVDGERGELIIAGYAVEELAPNATFEQTVELLWGRPFERGGEVSTMTYDLLATAAARGTDPMDALRMAAGTLGGDSDDDAARNVVTAMPVIVAANWRLLQGQSPIAPRADLAHTANYLYMLSGQEPSAACVRGLETYLN